MVMAEGVMGIVVFLLLVRGSFAFPFGFLAFVLLAF
jgi:hypothetical protein